MMASHTHRVYASKLNRDLRKKGIKAAFCHQVALLPQDWLPMNTMIGFNANTSSEIHDQVKMIMNSVRQEDSAGVEEIIISLCIKEKRSKSIRVKKLPETASR